MIVIFFCKSRHFALDTLFDCRGYTGIADGEVVKIGAFISRRIVTVTMGTALPVEHFPLSD